MSTSNKRGGILPPTPQTAALSESLTLILVGGCGRTRGQGISGLTTFSCRTLTATRHLWRWAVAQLTTHTHTQTHKYHTRTHTHKHTHHTQTNKHIYTHTHTPNKHIYTHTDNYSLSLACSGRSIRLLPPRDDSDTPSLHGMQVPHSRSLLQLHPHTSSLYPVQQTRIVITIRHIN